MTIEELFAQDGPLPEVLAGYVSRPEQVRFAQGVADTVKNGGVLLSEAQTGTGKTLAYLAGAVLSGKKAVISTATKNLQDQIILNDAPLLGRALGANISIVLLKGRENYLCRRRLQRNLRQLDFNAGSLINRIHEWSRTTPTGDRAEIPEMPENYEPWSKICATRDSCLGKKCSEKDFCFLAERRKEAQKAQVVVVNHHLFFADLALRAQGGGESIPRYSAVIFDEAHHLESVATQYFGIRLSSVMLAELVNDAAQRDTKQKPNEAYLDALARVDRDGDGFWNSINPPEGYVRLKDGLAAEPRRRLDLLDGALEAWLKTFSPQDLDDPEASALIKRARNYLADLRTFAQAPKPGEVRWFERRGRFSSLHAVPVDVAGELKARLFDTETPVVLTSATMRVGESFDYIKGRLGLPESARELVAEGSFDYERNCLIYVPGEIPDPNADAFPKAVEATIRKILAASNGRAFCLFTSFRVLKAVAEGLRKNLPYKLLVQGEAPKIKLLEDFKNDIHSVLLGAQSFWEGVDVPGEALSAVIIDKLPFASPGDPLTEARVEKIVSEGGSAFFKYQLPMAAMALRQGVGRLIRRTDDRGVVAILDRRLLEKSYGGYFRKSLPNAKITRDFSKITDFFHGDTPLDEGQRGDYAKKRHE